MHPHQIISVDQEQTVKDEKATIVIRKISVSVWGMGLELSPITINYLAVLKTFCVHVLCNLYNLSSLTEMKLFQWRRLVFVLNCWLQPLPQSSANYKLELRQRTQSKMGIAVLREPLWIFSGRKSWKWGFCRQGKQKVTVTVKEKW